AFCIWCSNVSYFGGAGRKRTGGGQVGRRSGLDGRFHGRYRRSRFGLPFQLSCRPMVLDGSRWMTSAIGSAIIESGRKGLESGGYEPFVGTLGTMGGKRRNPGTGGRSRCRH